MASTLKALKPYNTGTSATKTKIKNAAVSSYNFTSPDDG
jgi:hypothetical protein